MRAGQRLFFDGHLLRYAERLQHRGQLHRLRKDRRLLLRDYMHRHGDRMHRACHFDDLRRFRLHLESVVPGHPSHVLNARLGLALHSVSWLQLERKLV